MNDKTDVLAVLEQAEVGANTLKLRADLIAVRAAVTELVDAARLFKEWCDKEKAGPQWSSDLGRNGPNGEAEWREWWNEQLWLADEGPRRVEAALAKLGGAK